MYGPKDSFTVHVPVTRLKLSQFLEKTHDWINKKRVFGSVQLVYERENEIKVKSPVKFFRTGILATWYHSPQLIYYYTFIFTENLITVHAVVQTPTDYPTTILMRAPLQSPYNILRCKDFLQTYFDDIGVDSKISSREIFPVDEIENIKKNRNRIMLFFPLIIHGFYTIFGLLSRTSIEDIIWYNFAMIIGDVMLWIILFFSYRKYTKIHDKYDKQE
jgi:hypothetical protein